MKNVSLLKQELSTCEEVVMNILWDAGQSLTCKEVMQQLNEKYGLDYVDTTIYTFLSTLIKKGFVFMIRRGVNLYSPCQNREDYLHQKLKGITQIWFDGDTSRLQQFIDER